MANPKKFFHDQLVLLLLTVNAFLVLVVVVSVLLQLGSSNTAGYIVQYRPSLGISAFQSGSIIELFSFIVFGFLALITHTLLSLRAYKVRRQLALAILSLGILLQLLNVIISNALLSLR